MVDRPIRKGGLFKLRAYWRERFIGSALLFNLYMYKFLNNQYACRVLSTMLSKVSVLKPAWVTSFCNS